MERVNRKDEVWKPVKDYEGYYEISNYGRVKRLAIPISYGGKFLVTFKERILKNVRGNKNGHLYVRISKNNIQKNKWVHRLVAQAFIPNPKNLPQVNHINNIKDDNRVENLEWVTLVENVLHSFKVLPGDMRNLPRGENNHFAKVKSEDVIKMRELSKQGVSNAQLGRMYGLDTSTVWHAVNYLTWENI